MGNILFGLDIAKIVNDEIQKAGGVLDGTLTKHTNTGRNPAQLSGGQQPASAEHAFKGFIDNKDQEQQGGSLTQSTGQIVAILGDSLPAGVIPETNDLIKIEGIDFTIVGVPERDPAAALYECEVKAS